MHFNDKKKMKKKTKSNVATAHLFLSFLFHFDFKLAGKKKLNLELTKQAANQKIQ